MLTSTLRRLVPEYGYTLPSREEFLAELEKTKYTPDISKLEEQAWQKVFVIDELKRRHLKHSLLGEDIHYAGPAYTQDPYRLWVKRNDPTASPIPMKASKEDNGFVRYFPSPAKIKGEVWFVRSERLLALDTYKQNTVEFRRKRVTVILPYRPLTWLKDPYKDPDNTLSGYRPSVKLGEERVYLLQPWMYVGRHTFWEPHLTAFDYEGGALHKSSHPWCSTFYHVKR